MIKYRGIAMSDGLNRKRHYFSFKVLNEAYIQGWKNGFPVGLNHDRTRFAGWGYLSGIYFEPGKAYVTNVMHVAENKEEEQHLIGLHDKWEHKQYVLSEQQQILELDSMLGDSLTIHKRVAPISAVAFYDEGIVFRVFPELKDLVNDDGLIELKHLDSVLPGVYKRGKFLLFAHTYFRRNCSLLNSLNDDFLFRLQELSKEGSELVVRIHLDFDLIGLAGSEQQELEYSYWWGPHFSEMLDDIPLGVTRHKNEAYDNLFSNLDFTEFGWYYQDGNKTLEIEEVCDRENINERGQSFVGCRYVHSFLNPNTNLPTHLDGAIRAYTDEKILERLDKTLDKTCRDTVYTKLWRIDGDIPVCVWKELITHYYRDNRLIGEYFHGVDSDLEQFKMDKQKEQDVTYPLSEFVPINLEPGDGLRVYYYFDKPISLDGCDICIKSNEFIAHNLPVDFVNIMEAETITITKLLKRWGAKVVFPNAIRIAHEDTVFNFPIFQCSSIENASLLQKAILTFCKTWDSNKDDRLISFTFALNVDNEKSIFVSLAGHIKDYLHLFNELGTDIPKCEYTEWLERIYEINNKFKTSNFNPKPSEIITPSKELQFKRILVPSECISDLKRENGKITAEMQLPYETLQILMNCGVSVAGNYIIRSSKCSKCEKEYRDCTCVKFIDEATETITELEPIGLTWTTRHAQK